MGPLEKQIRATRPLLLAVGALLLGNVILSGALAAIALRPAPVVIAPGVRDHQVIVPDQVPDTAVRKFATLYLTFFDAYTPETVEERSTYLLRFVAPEYLKTVTQVLTERATYVLRTKESAHLTLPPPTLPETSHVTRHEGGILRFTAAAERRIYIASELKVTQRLRYVLDLKPTLPSDEDPYGFVVVGQRVRPEPAQASEREEAGDGSR